MAGTIPVITTQKSTRNMHYAKKITSIAIVMAFIASALSAESAAIGCQEGDADRDWAELERINPYTGKSQEFQRTEMKRKGLRAGSIEHLRWAEELRLEVRQRGLKFWEKYPTDRRRFDWLESTVRESPEYWKDKIQGAAALKDGTPEIAIIDHEAQWEWEKRYVALRAELMTSPDALEVNRERIRGYELEKMVTAFRRIRSEDNNRTVSSSYLAIRDYMIQSIWDFSARNPEGWTAYSPARELLRGLNGDANSEEIWINAMITSPHRGIRGLARGHQQIMGLAKNPAELRFTGFDGAEVDLRKLRGKVVLVDIWSNYCLTCREMMPKIQMLYEKYRDVGLEVVGVWCEAEARLKFRDRSSDAAQALAVETLNSQGVTYTNCILKGEALERFVERYGLQGWPVLWLFSRDGLLVSTDLFGVNLEKEIRRALGLPQEAG